MCSVGLVYKGRSMFLCHNLGCWQTLTRNFDTNVSSVPPTVTMRKKKKENLIAIGVF